METANLTDAELINGFRTGKVDCCFEELYRRYKPGIYGFVSRLLFGRNPSTVEEIVQEVFVSVCRNLGTLREPAFFKTWLFRSARNAVIDSVRRKKNVSETGLPADFPDLRFDQELKSIEKDLASRIRKAVLEAEPKTREIVVLKFYENMTFEEIFTVTGVPVRTIKYRMRSFLSDLDIKLEKEGFLPR